MNDKELRQLQEKLKENFPNGVEESVAEPNIVTQLADIGQVAVLPGTKAPPDVLIPAEGLALRAEEGAKALGRVRVPPGGLAGTVTVVPDEHRRRGKTVRLPDGPRRPQGQPAPSGAIHEEKGAASASIAAQEPPASPGISTSSRGTSPAEGSRERAESPEAKGGRIPAIAEGRDEPSVVLVWVKTGERPAGEPPSGG
jgi:hypothetical protein